MSLLIQRDEVRDRAESRYNAAPIFLMYGLNTRFYGEKNFYSYRRALVFYFGSAGHDLGCPVPAFADYS